MSEEEILARLSLLFDQPALKQLARQSRFIEPSSSRLSGWMFLPLLLLMVSSGKEFSLSQMWEQLFDRYGVVRSKQSLDERFNTFADRFLPSCFEQVFEQTLRCKTNLPPPAIWERVLLTAATSFQLPSHWPLFTKAVAATMGRLALRFTSSMNLSTAPYGN
ncbi:hypothetical protein [Adhaeribacter radiodurans]|uniref:Uncharacterized protein n=1 Tax=Adhaeribacter radiodurans TaxID=2745197 RepID=A0A7L7L4N7_9BACT|nr:hypothetical protein [Adhaeribacter radiodurans]QMU27781.1 hypothetical protein HUW48_06855 [Adhaeribacter radiodurans]